MKIFAGKAMTGPVINKRRPLAVAPYLVFTDKTGGSVKKIGQSAAIACFLARQFGFYPKSVWEAAIVDQVIHLYRDFTFEWVSLLHRKDDQKKEEITKKMRETVCPQYFGNFAKLLEDCGGGPFFVGGKISLADLYVFDAMFAIRTVLGYDAGALFPPLQKLYDAVQSNPKIKAHVERRPQTAM